VYSDSLLELEVTFNEEDGFTR